MTAIEEGSDIFENWVKNDLFDQVNEIMSGLTVGVISVVGTLLDIIVGMIISVYVLYNKDTFSRQAKKVVYAILPAHRANLILHITQKSNSIFGGFIIGKIIDSAIIGVLCFIGTSLLKMPYALLVSVIVGVTNVIPYFGPFIGAIPSIILIILVDPMKGLYFAIFILALQQLDGNYIGPKILGGSTGLTSFWVIFAIMIGGGLYGFVGMLLGVPTCALLLYLSKLWLNYRLEKKNLPTNSESYDELSYVDDNGNYVHSEEHIAAREMASEVKEDNSEEKGE
jgi:predicted PurR-regulated permease PerM